MHKIIKKLGVIDKNGKFIITADLSDLRLLWNKQLKNQKIDSEIEDFEIKSANYENSKEVYYFLFSSLKNKNGTMVNALRLDGNMELELESGGSTTCTGCNVGCIPTKVVKTVNNWYCASPCYPSESCVKTQTVTY